MNFVDDYILMNKALLSNLKWYQIVKKIEYTLCIKRLERISKAIDSGNIEFMGKGKV